jgi:hypothetical protein
MFSSLPCRKGLGDDLAGRSHPGRKDLLSEPDRYTIDRYNRAPRHEPREGRAAFVEQFAANCGMDTISADQCIALRPSAVVVQQRDAICILLEAHTANTDMN